MSREERIKHEKEVARLLKAAGKKVAKSTSVNLVYHRNGGRRY